MLALFVSCSLGAEAQFDLTGNKLNPPPPTQKKGHSWIFKHLQTIVVLQSCQIALNKFHLSSLFHFTQTLRFM